jgi:hypothetical protein
MATLIVHNPVARTVEHSVKPAARLRQLDGATVGLYWNMMTGPEETGI